MQVDNAALRPQRKRGAGANAPRAVLGGYSSLARVDQQFHQFGKRCGPHDCPPEAGLQTTEWCLLGDRNVLNSWQTRKSALGNAIETTIDYAVVLAWRLQG